MSGMRHVGVDPDALYNAGKKVTSLHGTAHSHCSSLRGALSDSEGIVTHPRVRSGLSDFVSRSVLDPSTKLPQMISNLGNGTSDVAATTQSVDNDLGVRQKQYTDTSLNLTARVNSAATQRAVP